MRDMSLTTAQKSIELDVRSSDGSAAFEQFGSADVLVCNLRPKSSRRRSHPVRLRRRFAPDLREITGFRATPDPETGMAGDRFRDPGLGRAQWPSWG